MIFKVRSILHTVTRGDFGSSNFSFSSKKFTYDSKNSFSVPKVVLSCVLLDTV